MHCSDKMVRYVAKNISYVYIHSIYGSLVTVILSMSQQKVNDLSSFQMQPKTRNILYTRFHSAQVKFCIKLNFKEAM